LRANLSGRHGESKSYADTFMDVIRDKAAFLRMNPRELMKRLGEGDTNLMGVMLTSPFVKALYDRVTSDREAPGKGRYQVSTWFSRRLPI
jgi:hypothetical protein